MLFQMTANGWELKSVPAYFFPFMRFKAYLQSDWFFHLHIIQD